MFVCRKKSIHQLFAAVGFVLMAPLALACGDADAGAASMQVWLNDDPILCQPSFPPICFPR